MEGDDPLNQKNILLTHISIEGQFTDIAIYSDILYLFEEGKQVSLYHWSKWTEQIAFENLPIYHSPIPVQELTVPKALLQDYFIKTIPFHKAVRDFFVFRHDLYIIDEDGLFIIHSEHADVSQTLLAAGNFHTMALSEKNRFVLTSKTDGVFEFFFEEQQMKQWDTTPTARILWDEHSLLQLDETGKALQKLIFEVFDKKVVLQQKIGQASLVPQENYFPEALDLREEDIASLTYSLFDYLPVAKETTQGYTPGTIVPVEWMPNSYFSSSILNDFSLYIEESDDALCLWFQNEPYFQLNRSEYTSVRNYTKSRNYRNHLHILSKTKANFLLFTEMH